MNIRFGIAAMLSAGLLAACETAGPDRVETTNPTITLEYEGDEELEAAAEEAEEYCAGFYQNAELVDTDERDDEDDVAVFECE